MQPKQIALLLFALSAVAHPLAAQTLKGSRQSMQRQYQLAVSYDYTFLQTPAAVRNFINDGYLVEVKAGRTVELSSVSYPYARPEVKLFVERFSEQYFSACGEKMVVTSLTRPINLQPANASEASVHPTGMAVDLRVPRDDKCRRWMETTLLSLEGTGVLDVTREYYPPHYHVAVYTKMYGNYVASLDAKGGEQTSGFTGEYVVQRGDTLSRIAQRTGSNIAALRAANGLRNDLINVGQKLQIPGQSDAPVQNIQNIASAPAQTEEADSALPVQAVAAVAIRNAATVQRGNGSYTVRRGDTLARIAETTGTTVEALRRSNGLRGNLIHPGQSLQIPGQVAVEAGTQVASISAPAATGAAATYVVRKGDSLAKIAERTNTTVDALRQSNGLRGTTIHPGQTLQLPGSEVEAPAAVQVARAETPAPAAVAAVATTAAPAATSYSVRKGDTLARIAQRTGTTIEVLREVNGIRGTTIHPGQTLQLQAPAPAPVVEAPVQVAQVETVEAVETADAVEVIETADAVFVAVGPALPEEPAVEEAAPAGASLVPAMAVPAAAALVAAVEEAAPDKEAVTSYSVRKGDTLAKIAERTGTSVVALRRANGLHSDLLQIGQNLSVPIQASFERAGDATMEVEHKVRRGESLWRIANQYGTTVGSLRKANDLRNDSLTPGQVLRINVALND